MSFGWKHGLVERTDTRQGSRVGGGGMDTFIECPFAGRKIYPGSPNSVRACPTKGKRNSTSKSKASLVRTETWPHSALTRKSLTCKRCKKGTRGASRPVIAKAVVCRQPESECASSDCLSSCPFHVFSMGSLPHFHFKSLFQTLFGLLNPDRYRTHKKNILCGGDSFQGPCLFGSMLNRR